MTASEDLHLRTEAVAGHLRPLRRALTAWLRAAGVDDETADDLLLAVSEALENACDHAYAGVAAPGAMTLQAVTGDDALVITVHDDGAWHPKCTGPTYRGRGLQLIHGLADAQLHSDHRGTTVTLTHPRAC